MNTYIFIVYALFINTETMTPRTVSGTHIEPSLEVCESRGHEWYKKVSDDGAFYAVWACVESAVAGGGRIKR